MYILFPSSYINKNKVNEEFAKEYAAAISAGFNILLFNQELWDTKREISLLESPSKKENSFEDAVYRGWMMKPEEYFVFYEKLHNNGVNLVTSSEAYSNLHVFKNSYQTVSANAPKTIFFDSIKDINLDQLNRELGKFMIKDFVKSVKGTDFPKFFEKPTQDNFNYWMKKFVEYRGSLFTGGIQAKEYLDLAYYNGTPNEYRVFYANGNVISVSRNSNQPSYTSEVPITMIEKYSVFNSPFYTVDYIECKNGTFKVIETGDGGVSGLSPNQNEFVFYRALYHALEIEMEKEIEYDD